MWLCQKADEARDIPVGDGGSGAPLNAAQPDEAFLSPSERLQGGRRPPYPLEVMLRIHSMQNWYSLSDEATENDLIDIACIRHFLKKYQLGEQIFAAIREHLKEQGLLIWEGTMVDAVIIGSPVAPWRGEGGLWGCRVPGIGEERGEDRRDVECRIAMRPGKTAPPASDSSRTIAGLNRVS